MLMLNVFIYLSTVLQLEGILHSTRNEVFFPADARSAWLWCSPGHVSSQVP